MKQLLPFRFLPVLILFLLSSGCDKNERATHTYTIMSPVYVDKADVLANVKGGPVQELASPGKIFIRGNHLFVNEIDKGVHIYDNSDPTSPRPVSFISIPGNLDVAVSGNYLYADMYTDMLTIDIEDPVNAKLVDTSANVFPERIYATGSYDDPNKIIVGWEVKDTTIFVDDVNRWVLQCAFCAIATADGGATDNFKSYVPGIAGSMARFVVVNSYLYGVNQSSLIVFNITNAASPLRTGDINLGWDIETVYPFMNKLFIGSSTGMFIFNIDNPAAPQPEGTFSHARACDPVVADGEYAYVTLRTNTNACTGASNQLDILDVSDVREPRLVRTYPMFNPHGLSKDDNLLFICDGAEGVKVYDATDVTDLKMIEALPGLTAFDAIAWSGRLIVSAQNGLYQYDYSTPDNIRLLSKIQVQGK